MQTAPLDLLAQALLVCSALGYGLGVHRLGSAGRRWSRRRSTAFGAGLVVVWTTVGSPLAAYDDRVVTVHIVQHLLLMMAAPPLLVLGQPLVLAVQAAGRAQQGALVRLARGRAVRAITNPVAAWVVYLASMYLMLTDRSVYGYLIGHDLVHDASHAWLLTIGVAYWEPLLGPFPRTSRPTAVMSVLANMPFEVLVGIWLRYQTGPLPGGDPISDTQMAGEAFIIGATALSTLWLVFIAGQWAVAAWREDRRAARRPAGPEWWIPWWVEQAAEPIPADGAGPVQQPPAG